MYIVYVFHETIEASQQRFDHLFFSPFFLSLPTTAISCNMARRSSRFLTLARRRPSCNMAGSGGHLASGAAAAAAILSIPYGGREGPARCSLGSHLAPPPGMAVAIL